MPNVIFQPDLSMSIAMYNSGNDQFVGNRTIAEILEECQNLTDCDSIIIHKKTNYNGYSAVVPLKVNQLGSYHVGDNALYDMSGKQVQLFEKATGVYAGYYYAYINGVFSRVGSASMSETTIDNITYYYDYDNRSDDYPPIMYISPEVVLYINNSHLIGGGGAGSGYIGNSLLSNKKMVGYNVPTSSAESTKTESVNEASESPVSGKPKAGNGFAKIKLVRELVELAFTSIARTLDMTHLTTSQEDDWSAWFYAIYTKWNTWLNTDYILMGHSPGTSTNEMTYSNGEFAISLSPSYGGVHRVFPFSERTNIYGVSFDVKLSARQGGYSYILLEVDNITDEKTLGGHAEVLTAMKPTDMVFDFTFQFEDTYWHHVEYVFSEPVINANYMQIAMFGLYSGNIKNIKFLT